MDTLGLGDLRYQHATNKACPLGPWRAHGAQGVQMGSRNGPHGVPVGQVQPGAQCYAGLPTCLFESLPRGDAPSVAPSVDPYETSMDSHETSVHYTYIFRHANRNINHPKPKNI